MFLCLDLCIALIFCVNVLTFYSNVFYPCNFALCLSTHKKKFSLQQACASLKGDDLGLKELEMSMLTQIWLVCMYD